MTDQTSVDAADRSPDRLFYRLHVFACTNRRPDDHLRGSCAGKGAEALRDYMKVRVKELGFSDLRINASGCLDRCELGPTLVIYPDGVWYRCRTMAEIDQVIDCHLGRGEVVEALRLPSTPTGSGS